MIGRSPFYIRTHEQAQEELPRAFARGCIHGYFIDHRGPDRSPALRGGLQGHGDRRDGSIRHSGEHHPGAGHIGIGKWQKSARSCRAQSLWDDKANECFRKYDKVEDSFRDHSLFLAERSRYAFLFELPMDDYRSWARGLQKAGYATSKKYADLLIRIIEDERLYRFDEVSEGILLDPHEIRRHAVGLRFIQAEKGDTWESLAAELDMSVDRLLKYNECSYDRELPPGMFVFLQKKKRRSTRADYRVQEGDDMYLISQKMGIRLKYLYQRNGLAVGAQPAVGQLLNLR